MRRSFPSVDPEEGIDVRKAVAPVARIAILQLLHDTGVLIINEMMQRLGLPKSSVSSNVQVLEEAGLIRTETQRARKGNQKICHTLFYEVLMMFKKDPKSTSQGTIEVAMPLGQFPSCDVSAPCGLSPR